MRIQETGPYSPNICYTTISVADPDPFHTDPAFHFDTDPDTYRFKEVMYKNSTFYTSLLHFPCQ